MSRLFICFLFLSFLVGAFGNNDASGKEKNSDIQSDCKSAYYQDEQDCIHFGIVPEKIITDTNFLLEFRKNYLSLDYFFIGTKGTTVFLENVNLSCLIRKDNLFLSILLI